MTEPEKDKERLDRLERARPYIAAPTEDFKWWVVNNLPNGRCGIDRTLRKAIDRAFGIDGA